MGGQGAPRADDLALGMFIAGCVGLIAGFLIGFVVGYGRGFVEAAQRALQQQNELAERIRGQSP